MNRALLLSLLLAAGPVASAPGVVIYRCVAADGAVLIQNGTKCPKGMREQKRVVATPAPSPVRVLPAITGPVPAIAASPDARGVTSPVAPVPGVDAITTSKGSEAPSTADAGDAAAGAPAAPTPLAPAPPLYACLTADAQRYYADTEHSTRCAPVAVVGLAGTGPAAAADACEVVEDRCEPVPDDERCAVWTERRRTAERAQVFEPEQADEARDELARIDAATAGTVCGR